MVVEASGRVGVQLQTKLDIKPILIALVAGIILLPHAAVAQVHPDFSGTWKMDESRSESAHQDVPIGPVTLVIDQSAGEFRVETRRSESKSAAVSTEVLVFKLDSTESTNIGKADTKIKVRARWAGPNLIAETEREINESTVTTMHVYKLGGKGNELTIEKTLTVQHGYQSPGVAKTTGTGKDVFIKTAQEK